VNIVKGIQSGLQMLDRRFVAVGGQEGMDGSNIRAGVIRQPTETAHKTLEGLFATEKSWTIARFHGVGDGINGNARPIRSLQRRSSLVM
jgi:hypothetical protein